MIWNIEIYQKNQSLVTICLSRSTGYFFLLLLIQRKRYLGLVGSFLLRCQLIADCSTFLQTPSQDPNQTPFQKVPILDSSREIMTLPKELQRQFSVELSQEALVAHLSYCVQHCNFYYLLIDDETILPFWLANFCGLSSLELQSLLVGSDLAIIDTKLDKLVITRAKCVDPRGVPRDSP